FIPPGDEIERLNYGFSILHCLAVGLLDPDSAGTGTVIRPATVATYATEAGFSRVDILPIEHDFWRVYRLPPRLGRSVAHELPSVGARYIVPTALRIADQFAGGQLNGETCQLD